MRQIVLDTETTGLNAKNGDRIIEIGCVEIIDRKLSGNNFHHYINPERDSEEGALAVHGLTTEFLSNKPKFAEIVNELLDYIKGAEVIIHNAPFDVGFLDAEFQRLGIASFSTHVENVVDTLIHAREMHPGKRNSLDALCDRYGISNSQRTLHGALLDSELLADVYLAMTRGQESLCMELEVVEKTAAADHAIENTPLADIIILKASDEETVAHELMLASLDKEVKGQCMWRTLEDAESAPDATLAAA